MRFSSEKQAVALDLMGGDHGPSVAVPAAKQALSLSENLKLLLVGQENLCLPLMRQHALDTHPRVEFVPSSSFLSSDCGVATALRHSQGTSMRLALELVSSGRAGSCVSAGSTAALMALAAHLIRKIDGIDRPALAAFIPSGANPTGFSLMLDLGANVSCSAENLLQFATMGAREFQFVMKRDVPPRVALLNVGVESTKGSECIKKAHDLLQNVDFMNFIGYIEGDLLFNSTADVIVCDGFAGNIALKTSEGLVRLIRSRAAESMRGIWSLMRLPFALFVRSKMSHLLPDRYNGASLLGLRAVVIKSHGSAGKGATANAVLRAAQEAEARLPEKLSELMSGNKANDVQ